MPQTPEVPIPTVDLKSWSVKVTNYLRALELREKIPTPKIVQLERKQPTAKATMDGLLMFDAAAHVPVYSFNKAWRNLVGGDGSGTGPGPFVVNGPLTAVGITSLANVNDIQGTSPSLRFTESDQTAPAGLYRLLGTSNNYALQKATAVDWSTAENIWQHSGTTDTFNLFKQVSISGMFPGSTAGLKIDNTYPSIWFHDDTPSGGTNPELVLSAGNGWFRFGNGDAAGSITDTLFSVNPTSNKVQAHIPFVADLGVTGAGSKFGAISVGVESGDQYITTSTVAMVFKLSSVAAPPASTINFYFRDSANATMAGVYGAGTASSNAVTIITREKGDLRYAAASSRRFKRDITKAGLPDLVRVFDALGLSLFTWGGEIPKEDERFGKRSVGFIAEEVVELLPEAGVYFNTNFLRTTFEERDVVVVIDKEEEGPVEVVQRQLFETNEEVEGPLVLHGLDANVLIAMLFAKIKQLEARIA